VPVQQRLHKLLALVLAKTSQSQPLLLDRSSVLESRLLHDDQGDQRLRCLLRACCGMLEI
jgi:hypothetical protein